MTHTNKSRLGFPKSFSNEYDKINQLSYSLKSFTERNTKTTHINYKIYHLLCSPFTYINAYSKISKNKGALTKGIDSDQEIMKFFGIKDANIIANKFKTNNYIWQPARRTLIPKPGRKDKRPIDTPTQRDRIVQEAIRGILESIFEPEFVEFEKMNNFKSTNYGFRPGKSCWKAVNNLKIYGQRTTYAIEGDIVGAYNNVNHDILLNILQTRIHDKKFLKVIKNLLKAGIMENKQVLHSLKGTPQGGIVSPLLFNIYMFKLDKYIYNTIINPILSNNVNKSTQRNPIHSKLGRDIKALTESRKTKTDQKEKCNITKQIKLICNERFKIPSYNINSLPKSAVYSRYADDWVLLITATSKEANDLKIQIQNEIQLNLKMELDLKKTKITRINEGFRFLGYNIKMNTKEQNKIAYSTQVIRNKPKRFKRRTTSRKITIIPDKRRLLKNLKLKGFTNNNGFPIGIRGWSIFDEYEIVMKYKQIFRGICNYYSNCDSTYILNRISYILQYSCAKTIATRKRITMKQTFSKYGKNLNIEKIIHKNNNTQKTYINFTTYTEYKKLGVFNYRENKEYNFDPFYLKSYNRTKMKMFLNCSICNSDDRVALHHINSLKNIKKDKSHFSKVIQQINRKQIPVCHSCHMDITHGRYDGNKVITFHNIKAAKL